MVKDAARLGLAIVRVLGDSTRTKEMQRICEISSRRRYRRIADELAASGEGRRLLAERPELTSAYVDLDRLRRLPASSLGAAYARHLDDNGIDADPAFTATIDVPDPEVAYLMRRARQTHDVWHVLVGLGIAGHEEVLLHWFTYGQFRTPVSVLVMTLGSMKHLVLEQRWTALRHSTLEAYRAGRAAAPLLPVFWEDLWEQPLERVRAAYGIRPLDRTQFADA